MNKKAFIKITLVHNPEEFPIKKQKEYKLHQKVIISSGDTCWDSIMHGEVIKITPVNYVVKTPFCKYYFNKKTLKSKEKLFIL